MLLIWRSLLGMPRTICLVLNPKSRRGAAEAAALLRDFQSVGINVIQKLDLTKDRIDINSVHRSAEAVVLAGGDGTISSGIKGFIGKDLPIGIVPLGTGNAFARDVGIPLNRKEACEAIVTGTTRRFDVGLANDSPFLNVCTLGLTAKLVSSLRKEDKKRFGWGAYPLAIARIGFSPRPYPLTLKVNGETQQISAWQAIILNGDSFGGIFSFGEGAVPDDGVLRCIFLRSGSIAAWFRFLVAMRQHRPYNEDETLKIVTPQIEVRSGRKAKIVVDGELSESTPCKFRLERLAVPIIVPQELPTVL